MIERVAEHTGGLETLRADRPPERGRIAYNPSVIARNACRTNRRGHLRTVALAVWFAASSLTGCASTGSTTQTGPATPAGSHAAGVILESPLVLTHFDMDMRFASSRGGATTLAELQRGHLMLLYFGYTQCPDICPATMADLSTALQDVPNQIRPKVQVVFITTDPAGPADPHGDKPSDLRQWLFKLGGDGMPLPFVGLVGAEPQTARIAASLGVALEPPQRKADGSVNVLHGTQVMAFISSKSSLIWMTEEGGQPPNYAADITTLVERANL